MLAMMQAEMQQKAAAAATTAAISTPSKTQSEHNPAPPAAKPPPPPVAARKPSFEGEFVRYRLFLSPCCTQTTVRQFVLNAERCYLRALLFPALMIFYICHTLMAITGQTSLLDQT